MSRGDSTLGRPVRAASSTPRARFDCARCPAYCCSVYVRVAVGRRDIRRIARHLGWTEDEARRRCTRTWGRERILRRARDPVLGEACAFLDRATRRCGIYEARPDVCRGFPGVPRCSYFDLLEFERGQQSDEGCLPLVRITFGPRGRGGSL